MEPKTEELSKKVTLKKSEKRKQIQKLNSVLVLNPGVCSKSNFQLYITIFTKFFINLDHNGLIFWPRELPQLIRPSMAPNTTQKVLVAHFYVVHFYYLHQNNHQNFFPYANKTFWVAFRGYGGSNKVGVILWTKISNHCGLIFILS